MNESTVVVLWWLTLVILVVVTIVVALLLTLVLRTAQRIRAAAGEIWTVGKLVANNTVHIPLLAETNRTAGAILSTAQQIAVGSAVIAQHANGCPGCPACVLSGANRG